MAIDNSVSISDVAVGDDKDRRTLLTENFETGNYVGWSAVDGTPTISTGNKINGTYGMGIAINTPSVSSTSLRKDTGLNSVYNDAQFLIDTTGITISSGNARLLLIRDSGFNYIYYVEINSSGIKLNVLNDAGSTLGTSNYAISTGSHTIRVVWLRSTAAGANDGSATLYIDGVLKQTLSAIDNDTKNAQRYDWGVRDGTVSGSGTLKFDDLSVIGNSQTITAIISNIADIGSGQGKALDFNAGVTGMRVTVNSSASLNNMSTAFTLVSNVIFGSIDAVSGKYWFDRSGTNRIALKEANSAPNGKIRVNVTLSSVTFNFDSAKSNFVNGQKYVIILIYNGTTLQLYIDGVLDTSISATGSATFTTETVYLGTTSTTDFWKGKLDDQLLFNRAFSAADISDYINRQIFSTTGLLMWLKFNEGVGTTTVDSSGNGNTGTLAGITLPTWIAGFISAEGVAITALIGIADTCSGIEALIVMAFVSLTETLVATETLNIVNTFSLSDTASGSDLINILALITGIESATIIEALTILSNIPISESGTINEELVISSNIPISDSGQSVETFNIDDYINLLDTGVGVDILNFLNVTITTLHYINTIIEKKSTSVQVEKEETNAQLEKKESNVIMV